METIKVNDSRIYSMMFLFDLHTGFLAKVLEGISDEDAQKRLDTKANHIAWLIGSLVHQRYEMLKDLGVEKSHNGHELFKDNKGIQEGVTYPSLADYQKDWDAVSPLIREKLVYADAASFDKMIDMGGMKMTAFELFGFSTYREANIIGQVALWRRLLGYDAMKYM